MSYVIAVWEGGRPADDQAALETFEQMSGEWMGNGGVNPPPSPAIRRFVEALLALWPDITTDAGADSPWSDGPLMNNAAGPIVYLGLSAGLAGAVDADSVITALARAHDLICFDPEEPRLL